MRLTGARSAAESSIVVNESGSRGWTLAAVAAALILVFALDRVSGLAPVQHLYYVPIILASVRFGYLGSTTAALAILMYGRGGAVRLRDGGHDASVTGRMLSLHVHVESGLPAHRLEHPADAAGHPGHHRLPAAALTGDQEKSNPLEEQEIRSSWFLKEFLLISCPSCGLLFPDLLTSL
jgi:hypothetical protein